MPHMENNTFLPTSAKEMKAKGWSEADIILITGDAYIDHPSFGIAIIARVLESRGYRVAVIPQPNWKDDLRDFKKLGKPRLFFGVTAGNMDSMINHYTAHKRLRSDDAYTPGNKAGYRPDYASVEYSKILKILYPDTPVIIGGIEASMRRFTHYDYWSDKLMPSALISSGADILAYGMAEKAILEIAEKLDENWPLEKIFHSLKQIAFISEKVVNHKEKFEDKYLNSHEKCNHSKKMFAQNFLIIEHEANQWESNVRLIQAYKNRFIIVNPPYKILSTKELDDIYRLPFTGKPHPRYKNKPPIPAYDMIRNSITLHRGCFGGCSFCTISAQQGKFVTSRSEESIQDEVNALVASNDFNGTISDLGGPSANMWNMKGIDQELCQKCSRPSCLFPSVCKNLNVNHEKLLNLYKTVTNIKKVKHAFVGSGIRYDAIFADKISGKKYLNEVLKNHISGRFKVAPEHSSDRILKLMRKNSFKEFIKLNSIVKHFNQKHNRKLQLVPYFISSHPGCTTPDMFNLSAELKEQGIRPEQVQDFTHTPMTLSTVIYYIG
ncbi:MAG: YgiQ family radical SAM protein, partial [Marinilabiliales bacterium]